MSTTELNAKPGSRAVKDPEILALAAINRILRKLDTKTQRRILDWLDQRMRADKGA